MTPITTLTACLMDIATCTSVEEIKTASAMEDKVIYCGECEHFEPDYDPYGLFDGYCDLYGRGRNKNSECYGK